MRTRFFPNQHVSFDSLLNDLFQDDFRMNSNDAWTPKANIQEGPDEWTIELAVPGMSKEAFEINIHDNRLTVSAKVETSEEDKSIRYREFRAQSFSRTFNLPKRMINEEDVKAVYQNGILTLNVPKLEEARDRGPRTIEIQ